MRRRITRKTYSEADLFLIRTCRELEGKWLDYLGDKWNVPVVPVGLIPPTMQIRDVEEEDNDLDWVIKIKGWLDTQEPSSVVYIKFGSELKLNQQDLTELAHRIEPFFWALKLVKEYSLELPQGFEDKTKGRGIVWKTRAPQIKILADGAIVGCMTTHYGSCSVNEKLHYGHALVTLPYLFDQALFSRVIEEKKVGIEVPRSENDGSFTRDSMAKTLRLMIVNEEGSSYRNNAKEISKVLSSKDLHNQYVEDFSAALQKYRFLS